MDKSTYSKVNNIQVLILVDCVFSCLVHCCCLAMGTNFCSKIKSGTWTMSNYIWGPYDNVNQLLRVGLRATVELHVYS